MAIDTGRVLENRYEVTRALRSGGMGAVYEARDRRLANTPCAIKEILEHRLAGSDADYLKARFQQEMAALAMLDHPGIPRVRDYFQQGSSFYIVMDYIDGQSLDTELAESMQVTGRPLEPEVVAATALQVLEILAYLHNHRPPIIHRDVKPSNLIREGKSGRVKLVDFGLAKAVDKHSQTMVGTPGYCAIEQMSGKAEPRSDLYSLGATMHHLLTGLPPQILNLTPLHQAMPDFRPELARIVDRATAQQAGDRYPDAQAMISDLRGWLQGLTPSNGAAAGAVLIVTPGVRSSNGQSHPLGGDPRLVYTTPGEPPTRTTSAPPAWFYGAVAAATVMVGLLLGQIFSGRPADQAAAPAAATPPLVVMQTPTSAPAPAPRKSTYPRSPDYVGGAVRPAPARRPQPVRPQVRANPTLVAGSRPALALPPAYPVAGRRPVARKFSAPRAEPTPDALPEALVTSPPPAPMRSATFERRPVDESLGLAPAGFERRNYGQDLGFLAPDGVAVGARAYFFPGSPEEARRQADQDWRDLVFFGYTAEPAGAWTHHDGEMCLGVKLGPGATGAVNLKFRPAGGGTRVLVLAMKDEHGIFPAARAPEIARAFRMR